ncbi:hypothetical protein BpHYR1_039843 [Brachionus plicatilis]|uniref:Uncharacterized protein n=1 Tax=Brachionus plicatilis TaxID=10195 RepID=A0A3M7S8P3_BRAPC|nr:hypothetical protein BpHYR1_039843 [Brachionus plicatilis]
MYGTVNSSLLRSFTSFDLNIFPTLSSSSIPFNIAFCAFKYSLHKCSGSLYRLQASIFVFSSNNIFDWSHLINKMVRGLAHAVIKQSLSNKKHEILLVLTNPYIFIENLSIILKCLPQNWSLFRYNDQTVAITKTFLALEAKEPRNSTYVRKNYVRREKYVRRVQYMFVEYNICSQSTIYVRKDEYMFAKTNSCSQTKICSHIYAHIILLLNNKVLLLSKNTLVK